MQCECKHTYIYVKLVSVFILEKFEQILIYMELNNELHTYYIALAIIDSLALLFHQYPSTFPSLF